MPGRAKNKSQHCEDVCPIDANPAECWVREGCRYWDRELALCTYKAARKVEWQQRKEEGFDGSSVMERIRINR